MKTNETMIQSIQWNQNSLILLDQRRIPASKEYLELYTIEEVIKAIQTMVVRGAPAIAIAGLFGIVLYTKNSKEKMPYSIFLDKIQSIIDSRPTAVNLRLAFDLVVQKFSSEIYDSTPLKEVASQLESIALEYLNKDLKDNLSIGQNGLKLFANSPKKLSILTHCNTGSLATAGYGTALGIIRTLHNFGYELTVYIGETRPYHQGSRLTAWELKEEKINTYIITDSMVGWLFANRKVDAVIVGADRIAQNYDTANKIGTFSISVLAKELNIPFYVAASTSTFDPSIANGTQIPIEMRPDDEITRNSFLKNEHGQIFLPEGLLAPIGAKTLNPGFDITPAKYIRAIITEKEIISINN